jgi:hypothetical protein
MFRKIWSQGNYHELVVEHRIASERLVEEAVVRKYHPPPILRVAAYSVEQRRNYKQNVPQGSAEWL